MHSFSKARTRGGACVVPEETRKVEAERLEQQRDRNPLKPIDENTCNSRISTYMIVSQLALKASRIRPRDGLVRRDEVVVLGLTVVECIFHLLLR